jgi:FkbM family methyltransferase
VDLEQYLSEEPPHVPLLRLLFKDSPPLVIMDVGCCEGEDSLRYLKLFPEAVVYGIEPNPENISKIQSLAGLMSSGRFHLTRAAVSKEAGTSTLYLSSGNPTDKPNTSEWDFGNKSSSLLRPTTLMQRIVPWLRFEQTIEVPTITLDMIADQNEIRYVDILHMDIQGAELLALQGAQRLLNRIGVIWVEVADCQIYQDQPSSTLITECLAGFGFSLILRSVSQGLGDHLYVNNNYFNILRATG